MAIIHRLSFTSLLIWLLGFFLTLDWGAMMFVQKTPFAEFEPMRHAWLLASFAMFDAAALKLLLRSEVDDSGLRAPGFMGKPVFFDWREIVSVKRAGFLGLGYYKIFSASGETMRLARFHSDQAQLETLVCAILMPEHPLRLCIEGAKSATSDSDDMAGGAAVKG